MLCLILKKRNPRTAKTLRITVKTTTFQTTVVIYTFLCTGFKFNSYLPLEQSKLNEDEVVFVDLSPARARIIDEDSIQPSTSSEGNSENDGLLKDVAAAADICRCNPCRCDPVLNDCTVSCNPVVETDVVGESPAPSKTGGCNCGCACGKKKDAAPAKTVNPSHGGCGCATSGKDPIDISSLPLSVLQPREGCTTQAPGDSDPCCIVVCLKHLKRQYLMDRPKCCA